MLRLLRMLLLASFVACVTIALTAGAIAAPSVAYLAEQLRTSDDYRVRTQAALALGASGDDAAVKPLCDALGDANASVKVASAAALGKLGKPAGLPCLKAALRRESAASVKSQIEKSIATLGAQGGGAAQAAPATPPPPGADTKFYVAIQVTNKTGRSAAEVDAIVRGAMQDKILAKRGYAVAPKAETAAQGGQVVKSKRLKGFFLVATVEPPVVRRRRPVSGGPRDDVDLPGEGAAGRVRAQAHPERDHQGRHAEREHADEDVRRERDRELPEGRRVLVKIALAP